LTENHTAAVSKKIRESAMLSVINCSASDRVARGT
jgi:hypothetical protein